MTGVHVRSPRGESYAKFCHVHNNFWNLEYVHSGFFFYTFSLFKFHIIFFFFLPNNSVNFSNFNLF